MHDALIETIGSFVELSTQDAAIIRRLFRPRHLEAGAHFLLAGDVCCEVGYITSGLVRYYINHDGEALTTSFGAEDEFVCDNASFLVAQPSQMNIEAVESTDMLSIAFDDLQRLYHDLDHGERFGRLIQERIFVQVLDQLASLYRDPPVVRYQRFFDLFPHLVRRLPQYSIASYIGVKPQSLSRIRRRFALP